MEWPNPKTCSRSYDSIISALSQVSGAPRRGAAIDGDAVIVGANAGQQRILRPCRAGSGEAEEDEEDERAPGEFAAWHCHAHFFPPLPP